MSPRVLVVDDHDLIATTLVMALCEHGLDAGRVRGGSARDVLDHAARGEPGVVLLDLDLGDGDLADGGTLVAPLTALGHSVLVVTGSRDRRRIAAAVAHGAVGWAGKDGDFRALLTTIGDVALGRPVLSGEERAELVRDYRAELARARAELARVEAAGALLERLSQREREVLAELGEGRCAATIAADSVVSLATVRTQIRSILAKLEVNSQLAAVALLRRAGELAPAR